MKKYTIFEKLAMGANTLKNIVVSPVDAVEKVNAEEYQKRLNICKNCEHLKEGKCSLCGCPVFDKAQYIRNFTKADLPIMACDAGKW